MPAKKAKPAKRGRKPAPPGVKLAQLTIRLPPSHRLALELIARELGISLSQVVERAVAEAASEWPVDGVPAREQVLKIVNPKSPNDILRLEEIAENALESEPVFILHMPKALRREHEQLFFDALFLLSEENGNRTPFAVNSEEADEFLEVCKVAYRSNLSAANVVEYWRQLREEADR